ncbi:hypothetical protein [Arthrobacter castelli]|uniref:hypothetical protein n=1 Tax=Arthrobacter castelli TaxID=271431 RepID=UPI00047C920F|nr:hypothetical protein [Arthrobacter castelli]
MNNATTPRGGLRAHQESVKLPVPDLVVSLRDLLGAKLVAYIGSVNETRAVREWAEGKRSPSSIVVKRLREAYHVAALVAEKDHRQVIQAWFQGMNPQLGDVSPARLLREGDIDEVAPQVLAAARSFASIV